MPEVKVQIQKGKIKFLHNEDVMAGLEGIGEVNIRRISDIFYDNKMDVWKIVVDGKPTGKTFKTRQAAIDWEHRFISDRLNQYEMTKTKTIKK